jgi:hypothetical protein
MYGANSATSVMSSIKRLIRHCESLPKIFGHNVVMTDSTKKIVIARVLSEAIFFYRLLQPLKYKGFAMT